MWIRLTFKAGTKQISAIECFKQLPYWANLLRIRLEFSLLLHMSVRVSPFIFLPKLQSQLCGLAAYAYNRYEKDTNPKKQNYKQ